MDELKKIKVNDEVLEKVSGGNDAEIEEIMDYIQIHDPERYDFLMHMPHREIHLIRYLYDSGVPVVGYTDAGGTNVYTLGSVDQRNGRITNDRNVSHAEIMAMIRVKIV